MKYNIIINQKALAGQGLGLKDSAILDYLIMYCNSTNPRIAEQRVAGWTWIHYQSLLDDMPLLEMKTRQALTPKIKKIVEAGYVTSKIKSIKGHKHLFVKLTDKVDSLFVDFTKPVNFDEKLVHETSKPVHETLHNNTTTDNTTSNNTTKDYIYTLPEIFGTNYQKRIWNFYVLVWQERYGFKPDADWKKLGPMIKKMYESYSEYQVAILVLCFVAFAESILIGSFNTDKHTVKSRLNH